MWLVNETSVIFSRQSFTILKMQDIVTTARDGSIAILTLQKEPVNSMSLGFWQALNDAFTKVNDDPSVSCPQFDIAAKQLGDKLAVCLDDISSLATVSH